MKFKRNVYCIEGDWSRSLRNPNQIYNALQFLKDNSNVEFFRKDCNTPGEFENRLNIALKSTNSNYRIIYFAFHGEKGCLNLGSKRKEITLESIADLIAGRARGKIIHFGSCNTLKVNQNRIDDFLCKTKATAISGYTKDIEFIASTFLDMLYFHHCQDWKDIKAIENRFKKLYEQMMIELGFTIHYRKQVALT